MIGSHTILDLRFSIGNDLGLPGWEACLKLHFFYGQQ
jgi:hypothetical protein